MKKVIIVIIAVSSLIALCSLLSSVVFADVFSYKRSTGQFSAW
ncbi:hypothetical protein [Paenibacillus sp. CAA11]|nr:hypothetical protein [Paenibacillus sp. CAA11]